ncbi:unnamed protein product [Angiostrongylus costaricensis]|uniref:RNA polymerase-associated protein LEO1 n=1 Tax=Angiostrongylus costaricensis TaxID=334426 RepID=A0A0R3PI59_ANGCS|nr:unnamed protein product [Angiostrongylus costaricensis]
MSDSGSISDDDGKKNGAESDPRDPVSRDSDSTPSHRSHHEDFSQEAPSGKESEKSDSGRSVGSPSKVSKSLLDDSSEDEQKTEDDNCSSATAARIFGVDVSSSDSDDERGDAVRKKKTGRESDADKSDRSDDSVHGIRMYPEEEEVPEKELPPTIIEASMSKVECDFGDGIQFMKIPNFFSVALKPFDPQTYEEDEDDDQVDEEGRNRLKLKVCCL